MQECNYCGDNSFEDMFSLKKWVDVGYCSLECVSKDIRKHEELINYYDNDISSKRREINSLSEGEADAMKTELDKSLQRKIVLLQKLPCIKSLMNTGRLKYNN